MIFLERKIAYPLRHPSDDTWSRLHRLASNAEPAVRRAFVDAIGRIRGTFQAQAIQSALARGDIDAVLRLIPFGDLDDALAEAEAHLDVTRAHAFEVARDAALPHVLPDQLAIHLNGRPSLTLNWQHISPTVLESIRTQAATRITAISDLSRQAVRQLVERAFVAGKAPRTIAKEISAIVGLTPKQELAVARIRQTLVAAGTKPARVETLVAKVAAQKVKLRGQTIARTETIRAANDGQRASWLLLVERGLLDMNEMEREWLAIVPTDGRTCPICSALDGVRAPIDGDYANSDAMGGPPQHPDCVLPGTHVAPGGRIAGHMERWFDGEIVRVCIETGDEIAVTPNHPILTLRGWVPARELNEADYVVHAADPNAAAVAFDPQQQNVETLIEQIPRALRIAGGVSSVVVPLSPEDIHGDAIGSEEVHVVRPDRLLLDEANAAAAQGARHSALSVAHADEIALDSNRTLDPLADLCAPTANSGVGCRSAIATRFGGHLLRGDEVALGHGAHIETGAHERATDALRRVPEFAGELYARLAGHVAAVKITQLKRGDRWKGHVYNLETEGGWYIANTVLVHNCRCTEQLVPIDDGEDDS